MAYYTKVLQPDETVKVVGRLHWSIYRRERSCVLAIAVALLVFSDRLPESRLAALCADGGRGGRPVWASCCCSAPGSAGEATEIVVTDRRVIFKRGLLSRHTVEMNVSKIETVDVEQGLSGRIWGYGTLLIRGTGAGFEPLVGRGLAARASATRSWRGSRRFSPSPRVAL